MKGLFQRKGLCTGQFLGPMARARQSQTEAQRFFDEGNSQRLFLEEKNRYDKAAASQRAQKLSGTERKGAKAQRRQGRHPLCVFAPLRLCVFSFFFSFLHASLPSVYDLSLPAQVAQLFVIPVGEEFSPEQINQVKKLIQEEGIGGILLKRGTISGQRKLIQELQSISSIPLLILQDAEWGIAMQIQDAEPLGKNEILGKTSDPSSLYLIGQEIGRQCLSVLADLNLAPVVDLATEPLNPLISPRSFGADPTHVSRCAESIYLGMRSQGVFGCAKHFPGHGAVEKDSHLELPYLSRSKQELQERELIPFQRMIDLKIDAIMTAHIVAPSITGDPDLPVTFSKKAVKDLLRDQMGFTGLIMTDALNMKALTLHYPPDLIAIRALLAGHDLLLYGDHLALPINEILFYQVPVALQAVRQAIQQGVISQEELALSVDRLLQAKQVFWINKNFSINYN